MKWVSIIAVSLFPHSLKSVITFKKADGMGVWSLFIDNERDSIFFGTKAAWSLATVEQNGWMKTALCKRK